MKNAKRYGILITCLAWAACPALADEVAQPWGTINGNIAGTAATDHPSMTFSSDWASGAVIDWELDIRALDVDRVQTGAMTFDEEGNIYWKGSTFFSANGARVASVSPAGSLRWAATDSDGVTPHLLGAFDTTSAVVGDGGATGRVYSIGNSTAGAVVVAYSKATGVKVWETVLPGAVFPGRDGNLTPVLYNGKLYVKSAGANPQIYQVDSATGAIDWNNAVAGIPTIGGDFEGGMTLIPDVFGAGMHGLYFNGTSGNGLDGIPEMYAVKLDTVGMSASLAWSDDGGHVNRSHVIDVADAGRVCTHTWTDFDIGGGVKPAFFCWNYDGTFRSASTNDANSGHGFYDVGVLDFDGNDVLAGGFDGRIVRYSDIQGSGPVSTLYDSAGFEALTVGDLPGQDGWVESTSVPGGEPDYGKVQVIADPTGAGMGNVIKFDAPGTAEGWLGVARPAGPSTKDVVIIEWDQYRTDNNDNFWIADAIDYAGWWAVVWDTNGQIHASGFDNGVAVTPGQWQHIQYTFDFANDSVSVSVNGTSNTKVGIQGADTDIDGIEFEDAPGPFAGEGGPVYLDNVRIVELDSLPGVANNGYYQLETWYGEPRVFGGLYKDEAGDSILVTGTNSRTDLDPSFTSRVVAVNVTDGTLIDSCADFDDGAMYIDDVKITGGFDPATQDVTHLDVAGFEGYTAGDLPGQANTGGTGSVTWVDDSAAPSGVGLVQVVSDPTGGGMGNVIKLDAFQGCGGFQGIFAQLAAEATDNVVNISWKQYREDVDDNVWVADDPSFNRWWAFQHDLAGAIWALEFGPHFECGTSDGKPAVPLTADVWQEVRYELDNEFGIVSLYLDGVCVAEADIDIGGSQRGVAFELEGTQFTRSTAAQTTPVFTHATNSEANHGFALRGGPLLGPAGAGQPQHVYYFNTGDGKLVALKPAVISACSRTVVNRQLFYANSAWGTTPVPNTSGQPGNKVAKLPGTGQTTFENVSSHSRGINGIYVDMQAGAGCDPLSLTADDFEFSYGNSGNVASWTAAPDPTVTVQPGAGDGGSDRVVLTWADNAIPNKNWLQVKVLANANTGLAAEDVFYFGNLIGETGVGSFSPAARWVVNSTDWNEAYNNRSPSPGANRTITDVFDIDRNRNTNSTDWNTWIYNMRGAGPTDGLNVFTP